MRKVDGCWLCWECPSSDVVDDLDWRVEYGKNMHADSRGEAQAQNTGTQPVPDLWSPTWLYAALPDVPYLFPGTSAER
jgi:hypothetical protein